MCNDIMHAEIKVRIDPNQIKINESKLDQFIIQECALSNLGQTTCYTAPALVDEKKNGKDPNEGHQNQTLY